MSQTSPVRERREPVDPPDPVFVRLQQEVGKAKEALVRASEPDAVWACHHCGHAMPVPAHDWLSPVELQRQANPPLESTHATAYSSSVMSIALHKLIDEGVLELGRYLRVRRVT